MIGFGTRRSRGARAVVVRTALSRLASRLASQFAFSCSRPPSGRPKSVLPPALLTSTSIRSGSSSSSRSTCPGSVASHTTPLAPRSAAVLASTSARRPVITTSSPSARNRSAVARPIPVAPPVTTIVRVTLIPHV